MGLLLISFKARSSAPAVVAIVVLGLRQLLGELDVFVNNVGVFGGNICDNGCTGRDFAGG